MTTHDCVFSPLLVKLEMLEVWMMDQHQEYSDLARKRSQELSDQRQSKAWRVEPAVVLAMISLGSLKGHYL